MAKFYCEGCGRESEFVPLYLATKIATISRSTIYYWIDHMWVHWRILPSGRRLVCRESLSLPGHPRGEKPSDLV